MRAARFFCALFVGLLLSLNLQSLAQDRNAEAAQKAAESWLGLVDAGKYADSYTTAGVVFRAALSEEKWVEAVQSVRGPLGRLEARTLKNATYTKTLPGVPDGEYEVLTFEARYEHKETATETVTAMLEKDGAWRVVGYYIK